MRVKWENKSAERFLANLPFWNYVGEPEVTRDSWEWDPQRPESIQQLSELRKIALLLVNELGFQSPPVLWHGVHKSRPIKWGSVLIEGKFNEWEKVQSVYRRIWAAIFYPSCKRDYDFMLCINKYTPIALTRIQDADVRANKTMLEPKCKSVGLQFGYTTERPILLPKEPESCSLNAVRVFVGQLERFRRQVGCSMRELGEIPRFG